VDQLSTDKASYPRRKGKHRITSTDLAAISKYHITAPNIEEDEN
jgi:hypothetical protein